MKVIRSLAAAFLTYECHCERTNHRNDFLFKRINMLQKKWLMNLIKIRRYEKSVWIMIIIRFISMLGYAIFGPYLMLYLNQDRGLSMTLAGLVLAFSSIGGSL